MRNSGIYTCPYFPNQYVGGKTFRRPENKANDYVADAISNLVVAAY